MVILIWSRFLIEEITLRFILQGLLNRLKATFDFIRLISSALHAQNLGDSRFDINDELKILWFIFTDNS